MFYSTCIFYWDYVRDLGYEDEIRELLGKMKLKEFIEIHEENLLVILFYSWNVEGKGMGC